MGRLPDWRARKLRRHQTDAWSWLLRPSAKAL